MIALPYRSMVMAVLSLVTLSGCARAVPYVPPEQLKSHVATLGVTPTPQMILVDTQKQTLSILEGDKVQHVYKISTSKRGLGQRVNTFQTPQGLHRINEKIGDGVPHQGIFHRRQYVGTAWRTQPRHQHLKDYITTRILRLEGLQPGFNKGRNFWGQTVDSEERAIYIHGTTMEWKLGAPSTKGCVHMSAKDVMHLFNLVKTGTLVWIQPLPQKEK